MVIKFDLHLNAISLIFAKETKDIPYCPLIKLNANNINLGFNNKDNKPVFIIIYRFLLNLIQF